MSPRLPKVRWLALAGVLSCAGGPAPRPTGPSVVAAGPQVTLERFDVQDGEVEVSFHLSDDSGLGSYRMLVNDVPVPDANDVPLRGRQQRVVERLDLSAGDNRIELQVFDQAGNASAPWVREVPYPRPAYEQASLYYLGFGVAHSHDVQQAPTFADQDVLDVGAVLDQMGRSFKSVNVRTLVDDQVTAETVRRSRDFVARAAVDDTVVVFVSGRGTSEAGEGAVLTATGASVPLAAFRDLLASSPARRQVLWTDVCARRVALPPGAPTDASPPMETAGSPAAGRGILTLSSSRASETSFEHAEAHHGVFAAALLKALTSGAADANHDAAVTSDELSSYVTRVVFADTSGQQHPVIEADNRRVHVAFPTLAAGGREYDDRRAAGAADVPIYQPPSVGPVSFTPTRLSFQPGSVGPLRPLIKERNEAQVLADGKSYLAWSMSQLSFLPDGDARTATTIPMRNLLKVAASQDGRRAAVSQGYDSLTVLDLPGMGVTWKRGTGEECGLAFAGADTLYFHDRGRHSRLWRLDLASKAVQAIGPVLNAEYTCWGSKDGKTFIVEDETPKIGGLYAIDTATGAATALTPGPVSLPNASPDGSRACYVQGQQLLCVRVADRGIEVLTDTVNDSYHTHFDPSGRRLFFTRTETRDRGMTYLNVFCVADFADQKVYELHDVKQPWGGDYTLLDGGTGVVFGGIDGMRIFDLSNRTTSWVPGRRLYLVSPIAGRHSVLVGQEYQSAMHDLFILDLAGQKP